MKIKLSKSQWEKIGNQSGWIKKASNDSIKEQFILVKRAIINAQTILENMSFNELKQEDLRNPNNWHTDLEALTQHLDNASGRCSAIFGNLSK